MKNGGPITKIVRSLPHGQVPIPAACGKPRGIADDRLLQVTWSPGARRIRPDQTNEQGGGTPWLKERYKRLAPVREDASKFQGQRSSKQS